MPQDEDELYGAVEAGGTKFNCAMMTPAREIIATKRIATTVAAETLEEVVAFFAPKRKSLIAVGVASFGPIDLDKESSTYGFITTTPKPGWQNADVVGTLHRQLGVPVGWDTDVNGAALAESRWGAAIGCDPAVYITVGTGIGGGAIVNGKPLHGLMHPEMGHLAVKRLDGDNFPGICPYHGDCLEGMISGPALERRNNKPGEEVSADDPIWNLVAQYLAGALLPIVHVLSPKRIIIGGGVGSRPELLEKVMARLLVLNNHYVQPLDAAADLIAAPGLGSQSGVMGAFELARQAAAAPHLVSPEAVRTV